MYTYKTANNYLIKNLFPGRCNCYLIEKNKTTILIDTSLKRHRNFLRKRLKKNETTATKVDYVILTHSHYDHAGNVDLLKNEFKSKIIVHSSEAEYVEKGRSTIPNGTNPFTQLIVWLGRNILPYGFDFPGAKVDIRTNQEYIFDKEDLNIRVIHSPGHSKGSVSIIIDDEVAIAGDNLFGIFITSVFPPFADDIKRMLQSWRELLDTKCTLFLPGHGSPINRNRLELNLEKFEQKFKGN